MKYIFLLFCLLSKCYGQDYKPFGNKMWYSPISIIVDSLEIKKGDTLYLGWGSGVNKNFLFVSFRSGILRSDPGTQSYLGPQYSNGYLVVGDLKVKKAFGKEYPDQLYYINGTKYTAFCDLYNAIKSGEIVRTTGVIKRL